MPRSRAFENLRHLLAAAHLGGGDAVAGIQRRDELLSRRRVVSGALIGAGALAWSGEPAAKRSAAAPDVGIVGAGLAGLVCADALVARGYAPTVYETKATLGGRCSSLRGVFPGQVAERGGEYIDTAHKTMIALAKRFGCALEDVNKPKGEVRYRFAGTQVAEAEVVREFRAFVATMRDDLRQLSSTVTAAVHTPADAAFDRISLAAYLDGANGSGQPAAPRARAAIVAAYEAEYGLLAAEQSCLNFLLFIHADRRGRFQPFGLFSDERYHVIDGNDRIVAGLAAGLPQPVRTGHRLTRIARASDGRIVLNFDTAGGAIERRHDQVVVTLPFTVLRNIAIDPSVGIDPRQALAIQTLGSGTNAKLMVGLTARPWLALGGSGAAYSDQADHQTSWETNPALATNTRAIVTDFSSGTRGARVGGVPVATTAEAFLIACDRVIPGVRAAARRNNGVPVAHLAHWPSDVAARGSYTCYRPGQFTTLAGYEARSTGNFHLAGDNTDGFDSWQGYMEGACLSGKRAADAVLAGAVAANG